MALGSLHGLVPQLARRHRSQIRRVVHGNGHPSRFLRPPQLGGRQEALRARRGGRRELLLRHLGGRALAQAARAVRRVAVAALELRDDGEGGEPPTRAPTPSRPPAAPGRSLRRVWGSGLSGRLLARALSATRRAAPSSSLRRRQLELAALVGTDRLAPSPRGRCASTSRARTCADCRRRTRRRWRRR